MDQVEDHAEIQSGGDDRSPSAPEQTESRDKYPVQADVSN